MRRVLTLSDLEESRKVRYVQNEFPQAVRYSKQCVIKKGTMMPYAFDHDDAAQC